MHTGSVLQGDTNKQMRFLGQLLNQDEPWSFDEEKEVGSDIKSSLKPTDGFISRHASTGRNPNNQAVFMNRDTEASNRNIDSPKRQQSKKMKVLEGVSKENAGDGRDNKIPLHEKINENTDLFNLKLPEIMALKEDIDEIYGESSFE